MINKSELRLGNWVFGHDPQSMSYGVKKYFQVDEISEDGINCWRVEGFDSEYATFDPIPLTPEVLLAAGFTMEDKRQSKQHTNYFSMWVIDYKYSFAYATFRGDWGFYHSYTDAGKDENNNRFDFISCGIKYLHQLQNLYWCLCGEELQINFPLIAK